MSDENPLEADVGDLGPIYVSDLEHIKKAKELKFPFDSAFGKYKGFFAKGSVAHPAKMSTHLTEYLIRNYTKQGDTVVDPFGGIGTTAVVGAINDRNVVVNELESKFVDMIKETKQKVESEGAHVPHGKITVLQGDSRKLSEILSANSDTPYASSAVMSPPYAQSIGKQGGETTVKNDGIHAPVGSSILASRKYGESKEQIGNLPYTEPQADAVITSAPYARTEGGDKGINVKGIVTEDGKKGRLGKSHPKRLSEDPNNIDNLPYVDASVMSPPYEGTPISKQGAGENQEWNDAYRKAQETGDFTEFKALMKKQNKEAGYEEPKIDGAVTSPPYEEMGQGTPNKITADKQLPINYDASIFSPPYENTGLEGGDTEARRERLIKAGKDPDYYLGGTARNTALKKYDAVITSPMYEDDRGTRKNDPVRSKNSRDTIGTIDGAIASPPYEKSSSADNPNVEKYRKGGEFPIEAAITSPPYEDSMGEARHASPNTQSSEWIQKQRELTQYPNGKSPDQIGNLKKESYLEAVYLVYQETYKVVKPGGIVCVVVKPFQRQGKIIDLPLQTWKLLEKCGFELHDVLKMKLNALSFWRILHYQKNKVIPRLWHEYVVVVRKPDTVLDSFAK